MKRRGRIGRALIDEAMQRLTHVIEELHPPAAGVRHAVS